MVRFGGSGGFVHAFGLVNMRGPGKPVLQSVIKLFNFIFIGIDFTEV
ncbi:hypothetical protein SAMN06265218_1303 [Fodinibius sediminis]|uniref:Uncharacterized protein n=1 Tax=Fodinibius sediminis TaxID=1214077 RepID=A0A521FEK5_9BACT|nr:hypothetical protein SAMN06265218_1303 [Fodinibius sediminis]